MEIIIGKLISLVSWLAKPFVEKWVKGPGKVNPYILSCSFSFIHREIDEYNNIISRDIKEINFKKDVNVIVYYLNIAFENTAETQVIFKNIEFEFSGCSENIKLYPQLFSETRVLGNDFLNKDKIIKLPPKDMTTIEFSGEFYEEDGLFKILECKEVFLIGERQDGKKFKYKIDNLSI